MNFNIWHKLWKFLNKPLFVKKSTFDPLSYWQQVWHLERCWIEEFLTLEAELIYDDIPYCEPIEYLDLRWTEDFGAPETLSTIGTLSYWEQVEHIERCWTLDFSDRKTQ